MTIRAYRPDDFDMVQFWAAARGMTVIPQLFSPNGFIVEDERGPVAVAFCYLTFDVPVASVDYFITRPRQSVRKTKDAWAIIWSAVQLFLKGLRKPDGEPLGYRLVRMCVRESMAPSMAKDGWYVDPTPLKQISYAIQ